MVSQSNLHPFNWSHTGCTGQISSKGLRQFNLKFISLLNSLLFFCHYVVPFPASFPACLAVFFLIVTIVVIEPPIDVELTLNLINNFAPHQCIVHRFPTDSIVPIFKYVE